MGVTTGAVACGTLTDFVCFLFLLSSVGVSEIVSTVSAFVRDTGLLTTIPYICFLDCTTSDAFALTTPTLRFLLFTASTGVS